MTASASEGKLNTVHEMYPIMKMVGMPMEAAMTTHRIAIAGSKSWPVEDENQVRTAVTEWVMANTDEGDTLEFKCGDFTTGVDTFVDDIAASFTGPRVIVVETHSTNPIFGSFADQARNRILLDSGVDIVMVFVATTNSTSAGNLARMAEKDGIPVITTGYTP